MSKPISPPQSFPLTDASGNLTDVWGRFFSSIGGNAAAIQTVTPTGSPYAYTANATGHLLITGGTVSGVTLKRARITIPVPTAGFLPISNGDVVTLTYTVAPDLRVIPE